MLNLSYGNILIPILFWIQGKKKLCQEFKADANEDVVW